MAKSAGKLTNKSSRQVEALLTAHGFTRVRRGKHDTWERIAEDGRRVAQVQRDRRTIPPKTLSAILSQADISKRDARQFWSKKK
jgi:predicted RNA binding protein YcfA (HicA-like mRNA interferase family)